MAPAPHSERRDIRERDVAITQGDSGPVLTWLRDLEETVGGVGQLGADDFDVADDAACRVEHSRRLGGATEV